MTQFLPLALLLVLFTSVQSGVIVDMGYDQITVGWYNTTSVHILLGSNGERSYNSKVAYRCNHDDYTYGYNAKALLGNQKVKVLSPIYQVEDKTENCTLPNDKTAILAFQLDNLYYKLDANNTHRSLFNLTQEGRHAPQIIVPSTFTPYDLDKISAVIPKAEFIPKHKAHLGMVLNAVNKKLVDMKEHYLVIECGAHDTRITHINVFNGTQFTVKTHKTVKVSADSLNTALVDIVGDVRGSVETQAHLKQIEELRLKLSSNTQITTLFEELEKNITVTRDEFNEKISDILKPLRETLNQEKETLNQNFTVFLIGGLSYTPKIKEIVESVFGNYSIRLSGDEYLFESIKTLMTFEKMVNSPFEIVDFIPFDVSIKMNGAESPFIKRDQPMKLANRYQISIPQTQSLEFLDAESKVLLRKYTIEGMEKNENMTFRVDSLEKGIVNSLEIPNATIRLNEVCNLTQLKEEVEKFREEDTKKKINQYLLMNQRQGFESLLLDFKRYLTSDIDDIIDVQEKLDDVERNIMWLEDHVDVTIEELEKAEKEFGERHHVELQMLDAFRQFAKKIEELGRKVVDGIDEMKRLGNRQYMNYAKKLNDESEKHPKGKEEREKLEKFLEDMLATLESSNNRKRFLNSIRWVWTLVGYAIIGGVFAGLVYVSFKMTRKPKKVVMHPKKK
ncbi:hypothetical protein EIN_222240 [Entamoeba invadens IP1]|uniref:Uncharacterized protein n=1 Tax=Entamoeba invadens IP1 TaxID=370355 RepID=A0A0A1U1Z9_ENTIV|nr:hypothetical protein EIN_222240 [Entamoeba invadens IP1]ELP88081.1 hypothetical protein EIN_222240 [Entamoeba invadens IP1]|eukprot:XP_004254852.1 hypothetical protein EIN_222240 [Entamoeba invadens IP1]